MNDSCLVNFHCHSLFSDGELTPEALAATLAAAGVRYASLTDHDTLEGLPRFQEASKKRGIGCIAGVELTTQFEGREAHLLAYGFDPDHAELASTLLSLRQAHGVEVHSVADSLRKAGTNTPQANSAAPHGILEASEAIRLLHRAGGRVFWAHPLHYESDPKQLDRLVARLKALGLDGLEAIYLPFSAEQQAMLRDLARRHDLLVCAGTDLHTLTGSAATEMPRADWIKFRNTVFSSPLFAADTTMAATVAKAPPPHALSASKTFHFRPRFFALRILLPTFIVLGLFFAALWGVILPSFEQTLLERKRELIRELTNSAWSILASYHNDEQAGLLTREQAQTQAMMRVQNLRYGPEGKDYFWIQDEQPRMVMHPYRADLNGQALNGFTDSRGVLIFVEFANLVKRSGEGVIDYVWQWKDDPLRLEPKESYVKGFAPWGWIIGTGLYTDDVRQEIARLEQGLINTALVISGAIIALLLFVVQQSYRIERERQEVVDELRDATERYHTLVEAANEGTLLVLDDHCRYANPTLFHMLGYTPRQLEFLELADLLPREGDNLALWERLPNGDPLAPGVTQAGYLKHCDGRLIECVLTLNPIQLAGQRGYILLAKDVARSAVAVDALAQAVAAAPIGVFRARAARRGVFVDINPVGRSLLPLTSTTEGAQPALADLFSDPADYDHVFQTLLNDGQIDNHLLHLETSEATTRFIALSARLVRDEQHHPAYINGLLQDVTTARKQAAGREAEIDRLQSSLLFLHEPIARLGRETVICPLDTSIAQLAQQMTAHQMTAALIASEAGAVIGIVTDHDLRARVLAAHVDLSAPVHTIMSAPLMKIPEHALIYEALLRMEEKGVHHLAVEDQNSQIVAVVDSKALIQFQRYGPIVLSREIMRAASPDDVVRSCERTAPLVNTLLNNSARPRPVTNMVASICDAATVRLIQLAIDDLGPPPAPFAFIAMGSQGRQEQTLLTDQDNGIIFAPPAGVSPDSVGDYFLQLGARVCADLHHAGYTLCRGNVMASNPRWCRALSAWISGFNEWVHKSEAQEVIDLAIFFDFRTVYGNTELAQELRRHIHAALKDMPAFYHHFAQNALTFKPPFRLLGNIYLGGATEHAGEINLKDAMMPMVSFARLYALRHQVNQTHTLERIEALAERGVIAPSSRDEISAAYDFLMHLRLGAQLAATQAGLPPTNILHPNKLGYIQQESLKQAFAQIAAVQKKISYDFLGGTQ
ncbi:MAG: cache domain-containing protein [Anaerolineae bacterium]|nr:cache domain-containing protein [Anaerolineae bacterium]